MKKYITRIVALLILTAAISSCSVQYRERHGHMHDHDHDMNH
ncbi:hypothetical protein HDF19_09610 [Mucilaginibacter sp. E4BP6]|jgi:hypothetical protein|nr:hypothetical protein [Mucilaginibacter sp. E4BP6]NYE67733.1 hypothetical protein [Mucilaginibacter sp. E4BP6]